MERYKTIVNREQMSFSPLCFDDVIDENNPVRAIDAIVESMEIPTLGFKYSETASTGQNPTVQLTCSNCIHIAISTESDRAGKSQGNAVEILN